jgi:hypothetical protein
MRFLIGCRMDLTSPVLATLLRPFLFSNTSHFVHELISFARSPLEMQSYDRRAQYDDAPVAERVVRAMLCCAALPHRTTVQGGDQGHVAPT